MMMFCLSFTLRHFVIVVACWCCYCLFLTIFNLSSVFFYFIFNKFSMVFVLHIGFFFVRISFNERRQKLFDDNWSNEISRQGTCIDAFTNELYYIQHHSQLAYVKHYCLTWILDQWCTCHETKKKKTKQTWRTDGLTDLA